MRRSVFYILLFFACLSCQNAEAKIKQKPVYIFGFAASFTDSVSYITDVQYLDSSFVDSKTKFLIGRNMYSVQLQQYLQKNEGCKQPVTAIYFGDKKEKLQKKQLSIRHRYEKYRDFTVKTVDCIFTPEAYYGEEEVEMLKSDKANQKANKKSKKD